VAEAPARADFRRARAQDVRLEPPEAERSERGSIIVTTNLPFSEWTTLFENTAMVAAMIDRLTFQSCVLDMNGESYRLAKTKGSRK